MSSKYPENDFENIWVFSRWRNVKRMTQQCVKYAKVKGIKLSLLSLDKTEKIKIKIKTD